MDKRTIPNDYQEPEARTVKVTGAAAAIICDAVILHYSLLVKQAIERIVSGVIMKPKHRGFRVVDVCECGVLELVLSVLLAIVFDRPASADEVISVVGSWSGAASQMQTADTFSRLTGNRVNVVGQPSERVLGLLAAKTIDVGIWTPIANIGIENTIERRIPNVGERPSVSAIGRFVVVVVVHPSSPVRRLTYAQVRDLCTGAITNWSENGGDHRGIKLIVERRHSKSREIVQKTILHSAKMSGHAIACANVAEIISRVMKDRRAIGIFLDRRQPINKKELKLVSVAADEQGPFVIPTSDDVFSQRYPLTEDLYLLVRPDASKLAKDYCRFACGPEAAKILKKCNLYSEYERQEWLSNDRVAQLTAGKGPRMGIVGVPDGDKLSKDLGLEFVKAQAVVQVRYAKRKSASEAAKEFLFGNMDLLLVKGSPPEEYAEKLSKLDKVLFGKSVLGVVVHPQNVLRSLTLEELRRICSGEIKKWPAADGNGAEIHVVGLPSADPVMRLYGQRFADRTSTGRNLGVAKGIEKPTSSDVIQAVGSDPAAIGFVDLSQLSADDTSVKLIGLAGNEGEAIRPTVKGVADGYPLARPYTFYVSALASQEARGFAAWLAANSCNDVLAAYRLVPPLRPESMGEEPSEFADEPLVVAVKAPDEMADNEIFVRGVTVGEPVTKETSPAPDSKPRETAVAGQPVLATPAPPEVQTNVHSTATESAKITQRPAGQAEVRSSNHRAAKLVMGIGGVAFVAVVIARITRSYQTAPVHSSAHRSPRAMRTTVKR